MNIPWKADNDWVAVFESDFSAQYFEDKTRSDCVRYWVRRSGSNRVHEAKSTGNRYELRNYEIFDKDFLPTTMQWGNWKCLSFTETYKDQLGCAISMEIHDPSGSSRKVICGTTVRHNRIKDHLLVSCIMYYLLSISKFKSWSEALKDNEFFPQDGIVKSSMLWVPSFVLITVYNRFSDISRFWWSDKFKFDTELENRHL